MTEPRPGAEDPQLIVRQLQAEIINIDEGTPSDDSSDVEEWGANFAGQTAGYSAAVQAAADMCIPAAEVTPTVRKRFINAAERALVARRARTGLLPVSLSAARRSAGLSLADVQAAIVEAGFDSDVSDLEAGRKSVREAGPSGAAAWIFAVHTELADQGEALLSYRRSLQADSEGELRPAAAADTAASSVEKLVAQVAARLAELNERPR